VQVKLWLVLAACLSTAALAEDDCHQRVAERPMGLLDFARSERGGGNGPSLEDRVKEIRLANGMVWLVVERPEAPIFTGFVRVRVGGADESPGATGLAHLFEHMAFKGTPKLGAKDWAAEQPLIVELQNAGDELARLQRQGKATTDEGKKLAVKVAELQKKHGLLFDENALARLYQVNGGVGLNATTDKDMTSYFVSLPKNRLELWLTIEAQRFAAPVLRDFYTERSVVQEERLRSIETNPGGVLYEELMQLAFVSSPYRWHTLGYSQDLAAMTWSSAQAFFDANYVASNAVGCVVGDVSVEELKPVLERTFGQLPLAPRPAGPVFSEPPARAQRRSIVTFDAAPRVMLAFRKPAPPARDDAVFDVMQVLLDEGNTGRLQQRLVFKDRLVQSVGAFTGPGIRLDNLFIISATPLAGVKTEQVEAAIWDELEKMKKELATTDELQKVRNRVTADFARSIESNSGLASALSRAQTLIGDWRYVIELPKTVAQIEAPEVQAAAKKYFVRENSVVVTLARPVVTP
jgi:predicted Zn-dependent peptidase